ncbi:MAG: hypothetical protein L3J02_08415, partial [Henriciella sp.]|nr:hypothetical protein [Henriciella sp.]
IRWINFSVEGHGSGFGPGGGIGLVVSSKNLSKPVSPPLSFDKLFDEGRGEFGAGGAGFAVRDCAELAFECFHEALKGSMRRG